MRVIKVGFADKAWPREYTTPCCESVLEIEPSDIKEDKDYTGGHNSWYIDCPVCGDQPDVPDEMYHEGRRWVRQQERIKSDPPDEDAGLRELATNLHARYCRLQHEDQCFWYYEEEYWEKWQRGYQSVWDAPTHKRWLEEAREFSNE